MIVIKNIFKKYHSKMVVNDVSVEFPEKSVISIIGPNGAGKSTLIGIMSRLITHFKGEVIIDGKYIDSWNKSQLAKTISILKQENSSNIKLTVQELVSFGRFPHCQGRLTPEDEKAIDEALEYLELTEIKDKYLEELSGGQRQRAYIAMTIAQNTKYIILDEPLNNLDMKHSVQIMKILKRLSVEKHKTIIVVLHDINFASVYSDFILALKDGQLVHMKETSEVIEKDNLQNLYNMEIDVMKIHDKNICVYF